MTGQNGHVSPGPGAQYLPGGATPRNPPKIIPLQPGIAWPTGERRARLAVSARARFRVLTAMLRWVDRRYEEIQVASRLPYELKLPLAPYRLEWRAEAAVAAEKSATEQYTEERYTHADGTVVIIRQYPADGSLHIMSDRGEIQLIDNAQDPYAADPVSVVRLP